MTEPTTGIDHRVFMERFALLLDRWQRTMSTPGIREYHAILAAVMTTPDFIRAANIIYRHDQFFPTPQRFIDAAAGGTPQELAENDWHRILHMARTNNYPDRAGLPPEVLAGITAAPMRDIINANEHHLAQLRRDFITAHARAQETRTAARIEAAHPHALAKEPQA